MANTNDIPIEQTQVLVIGASMVGMTLTALLAKHGVRECIAVERHASTAIHPRAALFHRMLEPDPRLPAASVLMSVFPSPYHANLQGAGSLRFHGTRIS